MKKYIILLVLIVLLTGCSYKELNDLAIADALGIDYIDGQYLVTAQILNLKKESQNQTNEKSVLYEATGDTIPNAIRNISNKYPKILYLGHLELIIAGNNVVDIGIENIFDYLIRSPETRNDVVFLINPNGTAKEVLNVNLDKTESFPSKEIITMVETSMLRNGSTLNISFEEFVSSFYKKSIVPVTTGIILENNELALTNIIAINNNKIVKLSKEQSIAYNMLNKNFYDVVVLTEYKNNNMALDIRVQKSNIELEIKNNIITANINIDLESQISDANININLEKIEIRKELENSANEAIKNYINSLINLCKSENIDIIGLKNNIYKYHYEEYDKFKDKNIYKIADIKINSHINIYRYGNVYKGLSGDKNE